jgi:hypothetical protein
MAYITLGTAAQLTIKVPTIGSTDWADTMRTDTFLKIAQHQHTGSGDGAQLSTGSIGADAVTGAKIRLDNDEYLKARNAADTANINMLKVDTNNDLYVDAEISKLLMKNNTYITARNQADSANVNLLKLDGGDDLEISPDISKLNLKNATYLTGRNNADSADVNILRLTTGDKLEVSSEISTVLKLSNNIALQHRNQADSAYISTISVNTSDKIALGADLANAAMINDTYLTGRNNADSAYINMFKVGTDDKIAVGANILSANIETTATSLINTLKAAVTLADNQAAATSAGVVTLSTDESCAVHYRLVRNGVTQSGVLRFNDADTVPSESYHGTNVGVTFSVNAGALEYTSTSTGQTTSMTYVVIKE